MEKLFNIVLLFFIYSNFFSQENIIISSLYKGNVFAFGWNPGWNLVDINKNISFICSECSTVKNAYIAAIEINATGTDFYSEKKIKINDTEISFNLESRIGEKKNINGNGNTLYLHFKPFEFNCLNDNILFEITSNDNLYGYTGYYLIIECEDLTQDVVKNNIILNTKDSNPNMIVDNLNPIILDSPIFNADIGFSIVGHTFNFLNGDASMVKINGYELGLIAGQDFSSSEFYGSGVRGHFNFSNGNLVGLDDDTADNIMTNTDALAKINQYLLNNVLTFSCIHETPNNFSNYVELGIITHSTNCQNFTFSNSIDTTICKGSTLQLNTFGGQQYKWRTFNASALQDLSCTNCPNPVFSGDSSRVYTVQIWNNDSCSVIRPVSIKVLDPFLPQITATDCGTSSSSATANGVIDLSESSENIQWYSLNGGVQQTNPVFDSLEAGTYNITYQLDNGCQGTLTFSVPDTLRTISMFEVSPAFGFIGETAPIVNLSQNATHYEWYSNGNPIADPTQVPLSPAGYHTIELVAWQYDVSCADTFSGLFTVYDKFKYVVPNVFTPNVGDTLNGWFGVRCSNEASINFRIFNRWGTLVAQGASAPLSPQNPLSFTLANGEKFYALWDGLTTLGLDSNGPPPLSPSKGGAGLAPDGVYFYEIELTVTEEFFLPAIDLGQGELPQFPIKLNGFVQLVRN